MRFLVIGASGRSGQLAIEEALERGHSITALVRKPDSLPDTLREHTTIFTGSPLIPEDISKALCATPESPVDVVLFAMASRRASDSPFSAPHPTDFHPRLLTDSARNTMAAMKAASPPVRKIMFMSSAGTGESYSNVNFLMRFMFTHSNMRFSREDHDAAYEELRNTEGISYVSLRPWMLTDGVAQDVKVYPDDGRGAGYMPKISRASVARFMVEAAETSLYDNPSARYYQLMCDRHSIGIFSTVCDEDQTIFQRK